MWYKSKAIKYFYQRSDGIMYWASLFASSFIFSTFLIGWDSFLTTAMSVALFGVALIIRAYPQCSIWVAPTALFLSNFRITIPFQHNTPIQSEHLQLFLHILALMMYSVNLTCIPKSTSAGSIINIIKKATKESQEKIVLAIIANCSVLGISLYLASDDWQKIITLLCFSFFQAYLRDGHYNIVYFIMFQLIINFMFLNNHLQQFKFFAQDSFGALLLTTILQLDNGTKYHTKMICYIAILVSFSLRDNYLHAEFKLDVPGLMLFVAVLALGIIDTIKSTSVSIGVFILLILSFEETLVIVGILSLDISILLWTCTGQ